MKDRHSNHPRSNQSTAESQIQNFSKHYFKVRETKGGNVFIFRCPLYEGIWSAGLLIYDT